jgi:hypothetical protein
VIEATRRDVLRIGAAILAARLPFVPDAGSPTPRAPDVLCGLFRDPRPARAIGIAYLARDPQARAEALALAGSLRSHSLGSRRAGLRFLRERIEQDQRADRLAVVDGWLLAKTEAEACALTVLL